MGSTFQTIVLVVFGAAIVVAVLIFSGVIPGFGFNRVSVAEPVLIWGTLPEEAMNKVLQPLNIEYRSSIVFNYEQKLPVNFENDLVQALASGGGPDIVLVPSDLIQKHRAKFVPIGEVTWKVREFRDTFIAAADMLVDEEGIWGIPILSDPMILYTNRPLLASSGISEPPKTWSELLVQAPKVSIVTDKGEITKSYVALGRPSNIVNLKDILVAMFIQLGNPIAGRDNSGRFVSTIDRSMAGPNSSPVGALAYFLQFADPTKTVYSWNSALPEDRLAFSLGNLALYFGRASDLKIIQQLNPNLDFDVAVLPQRDLADQKTAGRVIVGSITNRGASKQNAVNALRILSSREFVSQIMAPFGLPPARRDLLTSEPADPYLAIFFRSALIMKDWLDPDPSLTTDIFKQMVQNSGAGRSSASDALSNASAQIFNIVNPSI